MIDFILKVLKKLNVKIFNDALIERKHYNLISQSGFSIHKDNRYYIVDALSLKVHLRINSSDILVFNQIFLNEEYKYVVDLIAKNKIEVKAIVDLGSNIGLSALYFRRHFPNSLIVCVEPDKDNFEILEQNTLINKVSNFTLINAGIWHTNTDLSINRDFRDRKSWSITLDENHDDSLQNSNIKGITIDHLIDQQKIDKIDFLKIDVEGAERYLFDVSIASLNFLNNLKVLAIELHEEFIKEDDFNALLLKHDFTIFNSGELTICIKNTELAKNKV